jgi:mono/diheme cytochrome c family protein
MLTIVILFIALLLPTLVLAELWRTRRVAIPDDAPEPQIDPVLSTAGMSRKIVFAMVALAEAFLLLIAYSVNEPFRQSHAAERQLELQVEAGAHTYVQYCLTCHGPSGRGFLENVGLPGKPLNRSDLQVQTGDDAKAAKKLIYQTVQNGRPGTIMPAWGVENGGPLNYAMIDELVALVNQGRWDVVDHLIRAEAVAIPTEPAITAANQVEVGKKIVTEGACASCHAVRDTPARGNVGPALDGIASRQIAGVLPFTRDNVKRWVLNPPQLKPGTQMPPYAFREQYLDAMAAYLETLR